MTEEVGDEMSQVDLILVDDDLTNLKRVERALEELGFVIESYNDPFEGFKAIEQKGPKLAIIDYEMPCFDGMHLIMRFSELKLFQFTRVFLMTGKKIDRRFKQEMRTLGYEQVMSKDISNKDLNHIVSEIMEEINEDKAA